MLQVNEKEEGWKLISFIRFRKWKYPKSTPIDTMFQIIFKIVCFSVNLYNTDFGFRGSYQTLCRLYFSKYSFIFIQTKIFILIFYIWYVFINQNSYGNFNLIMEYSIFNTNGECFYRTTVMLKICHNLQQNHDVRCYLRHN